jgi:hypothetical protein
VRSDREVLALIVNGGGPISKSLTARLEAFAHEVHALRLPDVQDSAAGFKVHFERVAESGKYYNNIFIDLTYGFNEVEAFNADTIAAKTELERRINGLLRVLKYGAQHMARSDGGKIWVLCLDHSVSMSVTSPSNPVTNYAAMAAVQSVAQEVMHFDVKVNLFLIHPPRESVDSAEWRKAKSHLRVYGLKYKPQSVDHVAETLHMYSELKNLTTTGALIPLGSGIAIANC